MHTVSTQHRAAYTARVRLAEVLLLAGDTVSGRCSADLKRCQAFCAEVAGGCRVAAQLRIEGPCRGHRHRTQPPGVQQDCDHGGETGLACFPHASLPD